MNIESLKKAKQLRLLCRILFTLVAFIAPLLIVSLKYKLFTQYNGYKLTVTGVILLVIILWRYKKRLMEWVNSWEYNTLKYVIIGFSRVYLFPLAVLILYIAKIDAEDLIFCVEWVAVCEIVAYIFIYPLEEKFDYQVKRITRGIERKSDYKEAIEEMRESNEDIK